MIDKGKYLVTYQFLPDQMVFSCLETMNQMWQIWI